MQQGDRLVAGALIGCGNCLSQGLVARRADHCHILIDGIHTIGILDLRIAVRKIACSNLLVKRAALDFRAATGCVGLTDSPCRGSGALVDK